MRDLTENCTFFKKGDEYEIRMLARGLTKEEVVNCFGEELCDLSEGDKKFLLSNYTRGRTEGKRQAVEDFFSHMKNPKFGNQVCLEYLTRFADDWPEEGVSAGSGFNFKVLMEK